MTSNPHALANGQEHGTTTRYRHGCRCATCRAAQSEYARLYNTGQRRGRVIASVKHGTLNAYIKRKCRCAECRVVWANYNRPYRRAYDRRQTIRAARLIVAQACRRDVALAEARRVIAGDPELAALVAAQEKDARVGYRADSQWVVSLNARRFSDGLALEELIADPAAIDPLEHLLGSAA